MKIPVEVQKILDACDLPADFAIEEHSSFAVRGEYYNNSYAETYRSALLEIAHLIVDKEQDNPTLYFELECTTNDDIDVDLKFGVEYADDPEFLVIKRQLQEIKLQKEAKAKKVQSAKAAKKKLTVTEQLRKIALENPELVQQIAKEIA